MALYQNVTRTSADFERDMTIVLMLQTIGKTYGAVWDAVKWPDVASFKNLFKSEVQVREVDDFLTSLFEAELFSRIFNKLGASDIAHTRAQDATKIKECYTRVFEQSYDLMYINQDKAKSVKPFVKACSDAIAHALNNEVGEAPALVNQKQ